MKRIYVLVAAVAALTAAGCSGGTPEETASSNYLSVSREYHPVHEDYAEYLAKNQRDQPYPRISDSLTYYMGARISGHDRTVQSRQFGRARVQFGKILDVTMQAEHLQTAFGRLKRASSPAETDGLLLIFSLDEFKFRRFRSHLRLSVSGRLNGEEILSRSYRAVGGPHTGREVRDAGPYALKRSIQGSTKDALDEIMADVIDDLSFRLKR